MSALSDISQVAPDRSSRKLHRGDPEERRTRASQRPRVAPQLLTLGLLTVLALGLLASVPGLRGVLHQIRHVSPVWILAAVALELASDLAFVVLFRLFFDRLSGRDARALAWTEQATGALLPGGGAGGLAIGGWLVHLAGAPTEWIVRRSGGLFFLTSAVNGATVIGAGVALIVGASGPHDFARAALPGLLIAPLMLSVAALPLITNHWPRAPRWVGGISAGVNDAEQTTLKQPSWRLIGAIGYLGFDIAVLWLCLTALGHAPSVPALVLAYNIGYLANTLPIPGGIGVLDAGLTGALALYGIAPAHAAAAVLLYHAIAVWVPGAGGLLAYLRLRPRLLPRGDRAIRASAPSSNSYPTRPRREPAGPAVLPERADACDQQLAEPLGVDPGRGVAVALPLAESR
jgi:uncharacterized membrane protein YbhN (UPF0104 family)